MNKTRCRLLFAAIVSCPRLLSADYDPPTLADISVYSTAIVDATVTGRTKEGFVTIEIHGYLKGRNAPTTVTGISLACDGNRLPPDLFKVNQRYVICLVRDQLYEIETLYPVRKTPAGELQCRYQDAAGLKPAEWVSLKDFRITLAEARKGSVIQDAVDVPGLSRPLWWLGDREFDLAKEPFYFGGQEAAPFMKHLEHISRPWTVPKLLAAYRDAAGNAYRKSKDEPQADVDARYYPCAALMQVLATTNDIRAVVALIESTSHRDEQVTANVFRVLQASFGIDRQWLGNKHQLMAALDELEKAHSLPATCFTPDKAVLAYANHKWFIWTLRDRFGDPGRHVIPCRTRYFRQRIGSNTVEHVYAMRDVYSKPVAVVLDDGTVVLGDTDQLLWVYPDGTTKPQNVQIPGPRAASHVVRGVPNGLLVQQERLSGATLHFVPLSNGTYDVAAMQQLGAEDENQDIVLDFGRYFHRFGNLVVWMGHNPPADTWQINVLDVKTHEQKTVQPSVPGRAVAFGGETFVYETSTDYRLISAKDGSTISVITDRDIRRERIVAVRNQVGYYFAGAGYNGTRLRDLPSAGRSPYHTGWKSGQGDDQRKPETLVLTAVDFSSEGPGRTRKLLTVTVTRAWPNSHGWFYLPFVPGTTTEDGLLVWNEGQWVTVPWLTSMSAD